MQESPVGAECLPCAGNRKPRLAPVPQRARSFAVRIGGGFDCFFLPPHRTPPHSVWPQKSWHMCPEAESRHKQRSSHPPPERPRSKSREVMPSLQNPSDGVSNPLPSVATRWWDNGMTEGAPGSLELRSRSTAALRGELLEGLRKHTNA